MADTLKIPNLYVFTGENTFLLRQQLMHWKHRFIQKYGDESCEVLTLKKDEKPQNWTTQIETMPLFAEKRMILIEGLLPEPGKKEEEESKSENPQDVEPIIRALQNIPDSNVIIIVSQKPDKRTKLYKHLLKEAQVKEFQVLQKSSLTQWIKEAIQNKKRQIDQTEADMLRLYCAEDMYHIHHEIQKLVAVVPEGGKIESSHIERYVSSAESANIFQFTDEIGARNPSKALRHLSHLERQGSSLMMIFFMIVRQLRLMIQVKYLEEKGASSQRIQSRLHLAPFQVGKLVQQVKSHPLPSLEQAYKRLRDMNVKLITGKIPTSGDLQEIFLLSMELELLKLSKISK